MVPTKGTGAGPEQEQPSESVSDRRPVAGSERVAEEADAVADSRLRVRELEQVLSRYQGQRLAIFIKGYPDPDAIASALAHRYLCRCHGVEAEIHYFEEPSHHENKALVKRLEIEMTRWSPRTDLRSFAGYCCVDTPTPDMPIPLPATLRMVSLVDHHKSTTPVAGEFVDIREDAGSVSAIYAEYLAEGEVALEPGSKEAFAIATALIYGIRTDTNNFLLATAIDFRASAFLAPLADRELLEVFSKQSISAKSMDILQLALDRKIIEGTNLIAGVGYVRDEDRDGIAAAADYLLRREGVDTVLVYGVVGGDEVDGSLRTGSHTVDPDKWMKDLFGFDSQGRSYGGGRQNKGGFQIPIGIFGRCTDRELLWRTVKRTIEDVFFEKIGAQRDRRTR